MPSDAETLIENQHGRTAEEVLCSLLQKTVLSAARMFASNQEIFQVFLKNLEEAAAKAYSTSVLKNILAMSLSVATPLLAAGLQLAVEAIVYIATYSYTNTQKRKQAEFQIKLNYQKACKSPLQCQWTFITLLRGPVYLQYLGIGA
jgi:hypothetical protein